MLLLQLWKKNICQICKNFSPQSRFSCIGERLSKNLKSLKRFFHDKEICFFFYEIVSGEFPKPCSNALIFRNYMEILLRGKRFTYYVCQRV